MDSSGNRLREYITCQSKREAEEIKARKIHEYNIGTYIEPSKMTVMDLCQQWYKIYVVPNLAISTQNGYRINLEKHIYPYIGTVNVQKLTPLQIQNTYEQLIKKGLSPRSIKYIHTIFREALQYAYKMQLIGKNFADFVSTPKQEKYVAEIYTEEEAVHLLECSRDTDMDIPINLALGLGLRRGEILALRWCDVDFTQNTVRVAQNLVCENNQKIFGKPKTQSSFRTILAPEPLMALLKQQKIRQAEIRLKSGDAYENNDLVYCCKNGEPFHTSAFSRRFSDFLKSNNLKHIRFHDLRHTNATLMLKYNVPAKIASERLGHSNIQTTLNIYSHVSVDMQSNAVNMLESNLFSKVSGD